MFEVLYVEDERSSVRLVKEAFDESDVPVRLRAVETGSEAIAALTCDRDCTTGGAPRPDLVLLDLDLTRMSGLEVLETVRNRPALCSIPVVVFTTSDDTADVRAAYECGANAFVQKPSDYEDLVSFAKRAVDFWQPPTPAAESVEVQAT